MGREVEIILNRMLTDEEIDQWLEMGYENLLPGKSNNIPSISGELGNPNFIDEIEKLGSALHAISFINQWARASARPTIIELKVESIKLTPTGASATP